VVKMKVFWEVRRSAFCGREWARRVRRHQGAHKIADMQIQQAPQAVTCNVTRVRHAAKIVLGPFPIATQPSLSFAPHVASQLGVLIVLGSTS
jgi:hypothetical protein